MQLNAEETNFERATRRAVRAESEAYELRHQVAARELKMEKQEDVILSLLGTLGAVAKLVDAHRGTDLGEKLAELLELEATPPNPTA